MIQNRIHIIIIIDHLVAANYTPTANLSSQLPAGKYNGVTFISLLQQSLTKFLECYTLIEDVTEMQVSNPSAQPQSLFLRGTQEWQF